MRCTVSARSPLIIPWQQFINPVDLIICDAAEGVGDGVLTATELARVAGVAPSTASEHLAKLVAAGLIQVECRGRNRLYSRANFEVSEALEALEVLAENMAPRHRPRGGNDDAIRNARCCYDHLAGTVGVNLALRFLQLGYIRKSAGGLMLTRKGEKEFEMIGIAIGGLKAGRRRLLRQCSDWSEHNWHLGGALDGTEFRQDQVGGTA